MSDIKPSDIEALIGTFEASDWNEMKLAIDGFELFLSKTPGARPVMTAAPPVPTLAPSAAPAPAAASRAHSAPDHWIAVRAPNLGTFYRAPKPGAPPYVKIGQRVDPMSEVCLIEVMKLFTTVFADVAGTVRQVLVEDAELVEFDQPLMLIEPDA